MDTQSLRGTFVVCLLKYNINRIDWLEMGCWVVLNGKCTVATIGSGKKAGMTMARPYGFLPESYCRLQWDFALKSAQIPQNVNLGHFQSEILL